MTLRRAFRPLRPDLDGFLFAQVGNEIDGVPLSVISALTRLGLDPWEEARRLSSFSDREAVEQLARLIADLPSQSCHLRDTRKIAGGLVSLLPKHSALPTRASQIQSRSPFWPAIFPKRSQLWFSCLVIAAAALLSVVIHNGFPLGIGSP